uniref:Transposase n=1 Tax=Heterorhabditis bacteriophora TaxID=37862 RepID=A0A1I7W9C1_HETBA
MMPAKRNDAYIDAKRIIISLNVCIDSYKDYLII